MKKDKVLAGFILLLFYLMQVVGALMVKPLSTFFWISFGFTLLAGVGCAFGFLRDDEDTEA